MTCFGSRVGYVVLGALASAFFLHCALVYSSDSGEGGPPAGDAALDEDSVQAEDRGMDGNPIIADGDPAVADGDPGDPAISVTHFQAEWTTPNTILWRWDPAGEPDDLRSYEVVVGTSQQDVLQRSGSAQVWTAEQNPELGHFYLPQTMGLDLVKGTITFGHEPATEYWAQVVATDTAGQVMASNLGTARTKDPPVEEIVVFSEEPPAGFLLPESGFERSSEGAYSGSYCYRYVSDCPDPTQHCFMHLRWSDIGLDATSITAGNLATTAFIEFAVTTDSTTPSYWSQVRIQFGQNGDHELYRWEPFSIPTSSSGSYRVYQVPLRVLVHAGDLVPLDPEAFTRPVWEVGVGGQWSEGSTTRLDEVRIRW